MSYCQVATFSSTNKNLTFLSSVILIAFLKICSQICAVSFNFNSAVKTERNDYDKPANRNPFLAGNKSRKEEVKGAGRLISSHFGVAKQLKLNQVTQEYFFSKVVRFHQIMVHMRQGLLNWVRLCMCIL